MKFDIFTRCSGRRTRQERHDESTAVFDVSPGLPPADSPNNLSSPRIETSLAPGNTVSNEKLETREERVARLRQQVRSGTYEIPVPQLVRILADLLLRRR